MEAGPYTGGLRVLSQDELSLVLRTKLSDALASTAIATEALPPARRTTAAVALLVGAVGLCIITMWDHGVADARWAMQAWPLAFAYALLGCAFVAGVYVFAMSVRREGWSPIPPGRYLLPFDYLEVGARRIWMRPFGDARQVRIDEDGGSVHVVYADGTSITIKGARSPRKRGPSLRVRLLDAQHAIEEATLARAPSAVDPFAEFRTADGWAIDGEKGAASDVPSSHRPRHTALALAALVGFGLGPALFVLRNRTSDEAMYAAAEKANTPTGYAAYLRSGVAHTSDVRTQRLPRAALDRAEEANNVDSLRGFLRDFPRSSFQLEAQARFHAACDRELEQAGQDLARLDTFRTTNDDCGLGAAVSARALAIHAGLVSAAEREGLQALRNYSLRYADTPLRERVDADLNAFYLAQHDKIASLIKRRELKEALDSVVDEGERE